MGPASPGGSPRDDMDTENKKDKEDQEDKEDKEEDSWQPVRSPRGCTSWCGDRRSFIH